MTTPVQSEGEPVAGEQQPTEPPPTEPPAEVAPPEIEEDQAVLVPALLALIAAYVVYKAAGKVVPGSWQAAARVLNVRGQVGGALTQVAQRALTRQREETPGGAELINVARQATTIGVNAGVRAVTQGLIWLDRNIGTGSADGATGPDSTRPAPPPSPAGTGPGRGPGEQDTTGATGRDGRATLPTPQDPPVDLAHVAASAARNAAQFHAASAAGWKSKTWETVRDPRVRSQHQGLHGVKLNLAARFVQADGAQLRYPGDPAAPYSAVVNCRCSLRYERGGVRGLVDRLIGRQPR